MPSVLGSLNRRQLLIGALPAALAVGLLGMTTACAPEAPPADLDDLQTQLDRARSDSVLAGDTATGLGKARPPVVAALTAIAAERSAHADALVAEITRLTRGEAPTTTTASPTPSTEPVRAPTVAQVVDALRSSAEQASDAAIRLSGYRAGLLGSIAASCTASYLVSLGNEGKAS